MELTTSKALTNDPNAVAAVLVTKDGTLAALNGSLDAGAISALATIAASFDASEGNALAVALPQGRYLLVGCGEQVTPDTLRRAGALAAREAGRLKAQTLQFVAPDANDAAYHLALGAALGGYKFGEFKANGNNSLRQVSIVGGGDTERAAIVAKATVLARDLVNRPANALNPEALAEVARSLAGNGLQVDVWDRAECERRGMGLYLAVARGSTNEPRFIRIAYNPANPTKRVGIVGKGVTFDTGGYDIKTADGMLTMKDDMAGSAAVIATMQAIAALKPNVAVTAYVAATDNVIAPDAMRPGDIYRGMNGKTVEVLNTDAEGRLTLADALAQAFADGNDEVIDLATLTGACVIALGREIAGLWASDNALAEGLTAAARKAGEKIWRLPLDEGFVKPLRNGNADLKNTVIPTIGGGAVLAAVFLREFTSGPWAHIDIAGPAFLSAEHAEGPAGATGYGVRTLVEYLCGNPA